MHKIRMVMLFIACLLSLFPFAAFAATMNAASCSQQDVQEAIDAALPGDTVTVPEGSCIWGDGRRVIVGGNYAYPSVFINKSLHFMGASTNIAGNGSGFLIVYQPYDFSKNWPLRISGFDFDGNGTRSGIFLSYSGTDLTVQDRIRIDHNSLRNFAGQALWINGQRGVADNNILTGTAYPIRFASGDDKDWWDNWEGLVFGTAGNNFYLEDNLIQPDEIAVDCQFGNRYAFRYNTINAIGPSSYPLFDMHGDAGGSNGCAYRSCFGSEMYGNHITLNSGYADFRGGKHAVFYNYISKATGFWGLRDWESSGIESCECVYCPSTNPQPQHISDSYAWNNRGGSISGTVSNFFSRGFKDCTSQCGYMVNENDEYYNYDPSFNGTAGTGCGALEEMPPNCTPGVAYWATAQSCSDLTGFVGDITTYPSRSAIKGRLYKCTAPRTWTAYYEPYAYPHPLREAPFGTEICGEGAVASGCWCGGIKTEGYCCNGYHRTTPCGAGLECTPAHAADNNPCDNCIRTNELLAYISTWKTSSTALSELMQAIGLWKAGC